MNTRKRHAHMNLVNGTQVELTDDMSGYGHLVAKALSQNFTPNPVPRPPYPGYSWGTNNSAAYQAYHSWQSGTYEYWDFVVQGVDYKGGYYPTFSLKDYGNGVILPASLASGTKFKTKEEASEFAERWIAAGCPGIGLESAAEYQRKQREASSAHAFGKARYWFSQMTDEDLVRLSEEALKTITQRVEREAKAAARAEEKRKKAEEKAKLAAAKAQAKADKEAAKVAKAAEKVQKDAEKAAKAAEKVRLAAEKAAKAAPAPDTAASV